MRINLESILTHANEKLALPGQMPAHEDRVEIFKRFLKIETERLRFKHRFGLGGTEIAAGRSYLIDLVICRACDIASSETVSFEGKVNDFAIVALGGYGRKELAPFSDVDILFLHAGRKAGAKQFVESVLYLLWDIGLTVGHSFRSVSECVEMARGDLHSRNALSEARLITGNAHLFRRCMKELDDAVFKNRREAESFLDVMRAEIEARYEKFGRTVCLQEPNVKEGVGGLRDLHAVAWVGHARFGARGLDDLRDEDHVTGAELASARRAYDFISRARNEAHFLTNRRADLLTLDLQPDVAASLGYEAKGGLMASELFMRDYYQRANELHQFARSFLVRALGARPERRRASLRVKHVTASIEVRHGKFYLTLKRGSQPQSSAAGFEVRAGKLYLKQEPSDFRTNAMRLMEVFSVAQVEGADLSDDLKLAVRNQVHLVNRSFRASEEAGRAFVELLRRKGRVASALRSMHETGFLGRFLPEFADITFLVQHDFYHKYTIDEHTLKAVEALDHLAARSDSKMSRFRDVFTQIEDSAPLYLGLLLHDIGKGKGGGHVARGVTIAERVCRRLGLDEAGARKVIFLIQHHLVMSHLSQRRDLTEDRLVEEFAATTRSLDNVNALLLLTYADTSGVGPGVWNDWKAGLLWELYTRTRSHFTGSRPTKWDHTRKASIRERVSHELLSDHLPSEVERHFAMMPERYLRATESDQMADHFRLIERLGDNSLVANWRTIDDKHCTELTICTRDKGGLFAAMAGTFTAHGANILSADLYTREDRIVLDTFKLSQIGEHRPIREEMWARIEKKLRAAIEGRFDVEGAVESWRAGVPARSKRTARRQAQMKPSVRFDSTTSHTSTIIEVRAEDQPGLAYKIASRLAALALNINLAKIATEKNHALDVFYVTDRDGAKLDSVATADVERALLDAVRREDA